MSNQYFILKSLLNVYLKKKLNRSWCQSNYNTSGRLFVFARDLVCTWLSARDCTDTTCRLLRMRRAEHASAQPQSCKSSLKPVFDWPARRWSFAVQTTRRQLAKPVHTQATRKLWTPSGWNWNEGGTENVSQIKLQLKSSTQIARGIMSETRENQTTGHRKRENWKESIKKER